MGEVENRDRQKTETEKEIIGKIEAWVNKNSVLRKAYGNWYVGVTNKPPIRRAAHNHVNKKDFFASKTHAWQEFNANTQNLACAIEKHFHDKGMLDKASKGGVKDTTKYVYVYKKYTTIFD